MKEAQMAAEEMESALEFEVRLLLESERLRESGSDSPVLAPEEEEIELLAARLVPLARAGWAELMPVTEGFGLWGEYWTLARNIQGRRLILSASGEIFLLQDRWAAWGTSLGVTSVMPLAIWLLATLLAPVMEMESVALRLGIGVPIMIGGMMGAVYLALLGLMQLPLTRLTPWTAEELPSQVVAGHLLTSLTQAIEGLERAQRAEKEDPSSLSLIKRLQGLGLEPEKEGQ